VKVDESGESSTGAFPFLTADEAVRLKTQKDVDAGRIDVLALYRTASGIFKAEHHLIVRSGGNSGRSRTLS
jgi:hypothetical protein